MHLPDLLFSSNPFSGFMILMYFFETYLDVRQHVALKLPTLPKTLEGVISQDKFQKSRAYSLDKRFSFLFYVNLFLSSLFVSHFEVHFWRVLLVLLILYTAVYFFQPLPFSSWVRDNSDGLFNFVLWDTALVLEGENCFWYWWVPTL